MTAVRQRVCTACGGDDAPRDAPATQLGACSVSTFDHSKKRAAAPADAAQARIAPSDGRRSVLMHWEEVEDVRSAVIRTGKSEATIRRLCKRHGLARQTTRFAPLEISIIALEMVMHGDIEALELLRAGFRQDERVKRYIRHLGLPG